MAIFYTIIVGGQRRNLTRDQLQLYKEGKLFQNAEKGPVRNADTTKVNKKPQEGIDNLREKYKEKFGKEVPVNKKNDSEWINNKLTN